MGKSSRASKETPYLHAVFMKEINRVEVPPKWELELDDSVTENGSINGFGVVESELVGLRR